MPVPNLFRTIVSGIRSLFSGGGQQQQPQQQGPNLTPGQQQSVQQHLAPPSQPTFDPSASPESGIHHVTAEIGGASQTFFGSAIKDLPEQILNAASTQTFTNAQWETFQAMSPQERAIALGREDILQQRELPISNLQDFQTQQPGILGNIGAASRRIEERTMIGAMINAWTPELTPEQETIQDRVRAMFMLSGLAIGGTYLTSAGVLSVSGTANASIGTARGSLTRLFGKTLWYNRPRAA